MSKLRKRFDEKFINANFHHRGLPCFCDYVLKEAIILFIEQEIAEAEKNMKEKCIKSLEKVDCPEAPLFVSPTEESVNECLKYAGRFNYNRAIDDSIAIISDL